MRRKITNETWEQMKTAYASGIGLREIARNMGIAEGTVLARAKREGWTRQIESAKAIAKGEETSMAVTPVEAVAMSIQKRGGRHLGRMANIVEKTVPHVEAMEPGAILDRIDDVETLDKIGRRTFGISDAKDDPTHWAVNAAILNAWAGRRASSAVAISCNQSLQSEAVLVHNKS
jgi:hypothetical protein